MNRYELNDSWSNVLADQFEMDYFTRLTEFVEHEYETELIYPRKSNVFAAFNLTSFDSVKVVIIGQDPYHAPLQANGLCFSVNSGVVIPPSLRNIFKEIKNDLGKEPPSGGELARWAEQGVLLLNATLTVRAHTAGSHQKKGWEIFTDSVIEKLSSQKESIVFILWGAYAQKKGEKIDQSKHFVLKSVHPSPLSASRGFFGNNHFSRCNEYLVAKGEVPIVW